MAIHSSIIAWRILMVRGPWWATVYRVIKSQTHLKGLTTHAHEGHTNEGVEYSMVKDKLGDHIS